jgi:hypothetical protein
MYVLLKLPAIYKIQNSLATKWKAAFAENPHPTELTLGA